MAVQIQARRGTATQWSTENPVLASGEPGLETDTGLFKWGNGTDAWNALDYAASGDNATTVVQVVTAVSGSQDATTNSSAMQDTSLVASITPKHDDSILLVSVDGSMMLNPEASTTREHGDIQIRNETDAVAVKTETRGVRHSEVSHGQWNRPPLALRGRYVVDSTTERTFRLQHQPFTNVQSIIFAGAMMTIMEVRP